MFKLTGTVLLSGVMAMILVLSGVVHAANHPEMKWHELSTTHYDVFFCDGLEQVARRAAAVAEKAFDRITTDFDYMPEFRVDMVIRNMDDYANGEANPLLRRITIWTNARYSWQRGANCWLDNVIFHEMTHIVQLSRATGAALSIRKLFGSYVLPSALVPAWGIEGLAQWESSRYTGESWDSHRDMLLRCAVLEGKLLTYDRMCAFTTCRWPGGESNYNQGFAFLLWLESRYGTDHVLDLYKHHSDPLFLYMGFDGIFKSVMGKRPDVLYAQWKKEITMAYRARTGALDPPNRVLKLSRSGWFHVMPRASPDGRWLAYMRKSRISDGCIVLRDQAGAERILAGRATIAAPAWSSDGRTLYYLRRTVDDHGSMRNDIFSVDVENPVPMRLTRSLRASAIDRNGKRTVAVRNGNGFDDLVMFRGDWLRPELLHKGELQDQFYSPGFSPDGRILAVIRVRGNETAVLLLDPDTGKIMDVLHPGHDCRDIAWDKDGRLLLSSDPDGIYNIYRLDLKLGTVEKLTDAAGGIFGPEPWNGRIACSVYNADGYDLAVFTPANARLVSSSVFDFEPVVDVTPATGDVLPYRAKDHFHALYWYPMLHADAYDRIAGLGTMLFDPAGFHRLDADIYWTFEKKEFEYRFDYTNRTLFPTLTASIYNMAGDAAVRNFVNGQALHYPETRRGLGIGASWHFGERLYCYMGASVENFKNLRDIPPSTVIPDRGLLTGFRGSVAWVSSHSWGYNRAWIDLGFSRTGLMSDYSYTHAAFSADMHRELDPPRSYAESAFFVRKLDGRAPVQRTLYLRPPGFTGNPLDGMIQAQVRLTRQWPVIPQIGKRTWNLYFSHVVARASAYWAMSAMQGMNTGAAMTLVFEIEHTLYLGDFVPAGISGNASFDLGNPDEPPRFWFGFSVDIPDDIIDFEKTGD